LVSWPLYRVLAGAALLPPLIALLTLRQPALPQHPLPPLEFDGKAAATAAASFVAASVTRLAASSAKAKRRCWRAIARWRAPTWDCDVLATASLCSAVPTPARQRDW